MARGTGYWTYERRSGAWYFGLNERAPPPYRKQVLIEAILDLDADGRLGGIEILTRREAGERIEPPFGVSEGD